MLSSFRAAALSAHLRPQPHSRPAAGTTNNLWWAVVDFLAELPQAGFPCSGEVRYFFYMSMCMSMCMCTCMCTACPCPVHVHVHVPKQRLAAPCYEDALL